MSDKFLQAKDIMAITGFKMSKARNIIKDLNLELQKKGFLTFQGRVSEKYFQERCFPKQEVLEEAGTSTSTK